jgi:hypothetical protein
MEIGKPEIVQHHGDVRYQVRVRSAGGDGDLWYELSDSYAELVSDTSDAALVALIIPAMMRGEDVRVRGVVSERLLYSLTQQYQVVLRHVIPSLRPVRIEAENVVALLPHRAGVATGFSGGIDSFCLLADHHQAAVAPGFRVSHLLFNNVGSHGHGARRLFRERFAKLAPSASRIGLPFIAVDSNLDEFYGGLSFQSTHTPRNASVALVLQRGLSRYLYASTFSYSNTFVGETYDMAYSDSVALPLLCTEALDTRSTGSEYTRVEKTLRVATVEESFRALEVCVRGEKAGNCSTCFKCLRTLLTLEIAGLLERYGGVFDLDAYRRVRSRYIADVLLKHDPFTREIVAFAAERGFRFPASLHLRSRMRQAVHGVRYASALPRRSAARIVKTLRHRPA